MDLNAYSKIKGKEECDGILYGFRSTIKKTKAVYKKFMMKDLSA